MYMYIHIYTYIYIYIYNNLVSYSLLGLLVGLRVQLSGHFDAGPARQVVVGLVGGYFDKCYGQSPYEHYGFQRV